MLEEVNDEVMLEETSDNDVMLEEASDNEVMLEEAEDNDLLLEEASSSETVLEEVIPTKEVKKREEARKTSSATQRKNEDADKRKAEQAKRRAEEENLRKIRERKTTIAYVIAALLGILAGTVMAFGLKDETTSWGESLALGYTLGLVVFFMIVWGVLCIVGVDSEGEKSNPWSPLVYRCVFALSTLGIICFCIVKGTFSIQAIIISIYFGLFVASCTNGISHFFRSKK